MLLLAYYLSFNPILPAGWLLAHEEIWNAIYVVVNPFTTGACILGAIVLIQYVMYDSWIVKGLLSIFYGMVILVSFIAIMGMTSVCLLYTSIFVQLLTSSDKLHIIVTYCKSQNTGGKKILIAASTSGMKPLVKGSPETKKRPDCPCKRVDVYKRQHSLFATYIWYYC